MQRTKSYLVRAAIAVAGTVVLYRCLGSAEASQRPTPVRCTSDQARRAEMDIASARSWKALYAVFRQFQSCDDGSVAEGFSESVTRLLSDDWAHLSDLAALKAPEFEKFVAGHIDESVPEERLKRIADLAATRCSLELRRVCTLVANAVKAASQ